MKIPEKLKKDKEFIDKVNENLGTHFKKKILM